MSTGQGLKIWRLKSLGIDEVVQAGDQFEAWDTLRGYLVEDFGLVVVAESDENGDLIPIQTETLMRRWGRKEDAEIFHALAVAHGLKEPA